MPFNRIVLFILILSLSALPIVGCKKTIAATAPTKDAAAADPTSFIDTLTFLGDSTTAHMQQRSPISAKQIWATKSRYLNLDSRITYAKIIAPDTGNEELITDVAARLCPSYLVITLGVDYGVYYYRDRPEEFTHYYEKLLSALKQASPDTVFVLQSIYPVAQSSQVITNDMIQRANELIANIAQRRGIAYVDQTPILADENGYLRPEFCFSEDGIHLTAKGYDAILAHLATMEASIRGAA